MDHEGSTRFSATKRRLVGVVASGLVLAGTGGIHLAVDRLERVKVEAEARRQAAETSRRLPDVWAVQSEGLATLARSAASNPPFAEAVRTGADDRKMRAVLEDDWWAPYRAVHAAVSYDGQSVAFAQDRAAAVVAVELFSEAVRHERRVVVRAVLANQRALLVAAAPLELARPAQAAMVMLSQPLDRLMLNAISTRLGAPLLLESVGGELGSGGSPDEVVRLTLAVERGGLDWNTPDGVPWAGAAIPVGQGLWLWTGASPAAFARELAVTDLAATAILWSCAAVLSVVVLVIGWRRPVAVPGPDQEAPAPDPPRPSGRLSGASQLGRYELLERIGEGGMAEIFAAAAFGSNGFRRFFVVKRLRSELASNADAVAHFIEEATLGAMLTHPNIVPVFDLGAVDGTYYLAEEYVLGRDLLRLRRRMVENAQPPLPAKAVLYLLDQLLAALEYAHDKRDEDGEPLGIVHRDVTPANVLISTRGEVKLLDFGIVKTSRRRLAQTQVGAVNGNLEFMAPEQARSQPVDARTDLFSAGLVAYFAAADGLYRGETLLDLLNRAAAGPGLEEVERVNQLSAPLPEILERALALDPADRYQDAAAFRAAIADHLEGGREALEAALDAAFRDELHLEQERLNRVCPRAFTPAPVAA